MRDSLWWAFYSLRVLHFETAWISSLTLPAPLGFSTMKGRATGPGGVPAVRAADPSRPYPV
jgi:hypothetical protein